MTEEIIIDGGRMSGIKTLRSKFKYLEQENRELKAYKDINEDFKKAWDELNKKYTEVLKLAKENADSNEYCLQELEQENKSLYEEKNCLHKIIDRLLENAGYSKDIASAEDFEDVYEDMQIKRNELVALEQENKQMKSALEEIEQYMKNASKATIEEEAHREFRKVVSKINEVLE